MITVHVPAGIAATSVDDFPAGCERSVTGSLRVRPGTLVITDDELAHLRKHHKAVARRLVLVPPVAEKQQEVARPSLPSTLPPPSDSEPEEPPEDPEPPEPKGQVVTPLPAGGGDVPFPLDPSKLPKKGKKKRR